MLSISKLCLYLKEAFPISFELVSRPNWIPTMPTLESKFGLGRIYQLLPLHSFNSKYVSNKLLAKKLAPMVNQREVLFIMVVPTGIEPVSKV
jgi:hypothetical protein